MAKDYIYYCFLVNPNTQGGILGNPSYYGYTERYTNDNVVAKLATDTQYYESVIEDFKPDCALIYSIEAPITLFKGNEKILPNNEEDIEKCILNQIENLEESSIFEYILSDTTLSPYDFMRAVKALYVSSV